MKRNRKRSFLRFKRVVCLLLVLFFVVQPLTILAKGDDNKTAQSGENGELNEGLDSGEGQEEKPNPDPEEEPGEAGPTDPPTDPSPDQPTEPDEEDGDPEEELPPPGNNEPLPVGLTEKDVQVVINTPERYLPYTDNDSMAVPSVLTYNFRIQANRTGTGDDNIVELVFKSEAGYLGDHYFNYPEIDSNGDLLDETLAPINISSSDPFEEEVKYDLRDDSFIIKLTLKEDLANVVSSGIVRFEFSKDSNGNFIYDGGVLDNTEMANLSYNLLSNDKPVSKGSNVPVRASSAVEPDFSNQTSGSPIITKISDTEYSANVKSNSFVSYGDTRLRYHYYYRNRMSTATEHQPYLNIYLPVGSEVLSGLTFRNLDTGTNDKGVHIAAGEVPNIPEGYYYILRNEMSNSFSPHQSGTNNWTLNIGGLRHRAEAYVGMSYRLPDAEIGDELKVHFSFEYTLLGSEERQYTGYTITNNVVGDEGWNFSISSVVTHSPGLSGELNKPSCGVKPGNMSPAYIRAGGFGYSHDASQKNIGSEPVKNVRLEITQSTPDTDQNASRQPLPDYVRGNFAGNFQLRVSRESPDYDWGIYKYYFVYRNDITGAERTSSPIIVNPKTDSNSTSKNIDLETSLVINLSGHTFSHLKKGEYVKQFVLVPMGTEKNPVEGDYAPKNHFHIAYYIGAWPNGEYPNGKSVMLDDARYYSIAQMFYDDEKGNKKSTNRNYVEIKYNGDTASPAGRFYSSDAHLSNAQPGEKISYTFEGYNRYDAKAPWNSPVITMRLPGGSTLDTSKPIKAKYKDVEVDVKVEQIGATSKDGHNVYRLSGMDSLTIAKEPNANNYRVPFTIDFSVETPTYIPAGTYQLDAVLSSDDDSFILANSHTNPLPTGTLAGAFGFGVDDKFSYMYRNSDLIRNIDFIICNLEKVTPLSVIHSSVTPSGGSTKELAPATYDEEVKVELIVKNEGNVPYTHFSLFDILPEEGYLNSTGALDITRIDTNPRATIYYTDTDYSQLSDVTLPITDIANDPNWSETRTSSSKAFYADFRDYVLKGGEQLSVTITFKIPSEEAVNGQDQRVYNQYSFSYTPTTANYYMRFESKPQGFSTESFYIKYKPNPRLDPDTITLPEIQSDIYLSADTAKLAITSDKATRDFFVFKGWSTDPDATKPEDGYQEGNIVGFTDKNRELILYPVWHAGPITIRPPERIDFGTLSISNRLREIPWQSVDGLDNADVGVTIGNFTTDTKDIVVTAEDFICNDSGKTIAGALYYRTEDGELHPIQDGVGCTIHTSTAESGVTFIPWNKKGKKYGLHFDQRVEALSTGSFTSVVKWTVQTVPK